MSSPAPSPSAPPDVAPSRLDSLVDRHRAPPVRHVARAVVVLVLAFLAWATVAELDEVAKAPGEVTPYGRVKAVQHLEGGLILDIYVTEGQVVREGDPLMLLDLATGGVNRQELEIRLDGLILERARLTAEAEGSPLVFPPEEADRRPDMVHAQREVHEGRRSELESTINVLRHQIEQRSSEIRELEVRSRATAANLRVSREKYAMSTDLVRDGLTPRMEHLRLQAEVQDLQGTLEGLAEAIPRARAALAEADARLEEVNLRFRREALEQLTGVEEGIARSRELLAKATDQHLRTEIRSPINGIVKNMRYNTVGGVVRPGDVVLDLVPTHDNLVVEARLNPMDRGYVREGQEATLKITTFDYARYGGLRGIVTLVAPDSTVPDNAPPYFRVQVRPEKHYLGATPDEYQITPGMEATVDIHTGTRTVLDYLIRPVLKLRHEAFRER